MSKYKDMTSNATKAIWTVVIVAVVVVGAVLIFGRGNNDQVAQGSGHVVLALTDAAANMGNVSEITMEVSKVELHSQANGWVTVSNTDRQFKLLKLNSENRFELLADAQVSAGSYDQVRLAIEDVAVQLKDGTTAEAKVPSGELKLMQNISVEADQTTTVTLDIQGDISLHVTGNGRYIFSPVVRTETRTNANANIASDNAVTVSGGRVHSTGTAGMDVNGEVKNNFRIDTGAKLDINASGIITINGQASSNASASSSNNNSGGSNNNGGGNATSSSSSGSGVNMNLNGSVQGGIQY